MAGRSSLAMVEAMRFVMYAHMTPYAAAKRAGIALTTMYKSKLYKMWLDGDEKQLKKEMDQTAPKARRPKKKEKFTNNVR